MKKTMPATIVAIALSLLAAFALAGCAGNSQGSSSSSDDVVVLDAEGVVSVSLDYNAGTSYEWRCTLSGDEDALWITDEGDKDLAEGQHIDGGPLQHWVTMRAANPGTAVLTCELVRPWEKDVEPAETQVYVFSVDENLQIDFDDTESTFENWPEQGGNS